MACSKADEKLTEKDKAFIKTYVDVLLVQAWYESLSSSERMNFSKPDSLDRVFAYHNTTRVDFQKEMQGYKSKPAIWKDVLKNTLEAIEAKRRVLSEKRK
ncbi:hypothetical protein [Chloroherpeton thalassium]|nr:hypothetical protein [Chloroherpeton thalassium]